MAEYVVTAKSLIEDRDRRMRYGTSRVKHAPDTTGKPVRLAIWVAGEEFVTETLHIDDQTWLADKSDEIADLLPDVSIGAQYWDQKTRRWKEF